MRTQRGKANEETVWRSEEAEARETFSGFIFRLCQRTKQLADSHALVHAKGPSRVGPGDFHAERHKSERE